VSKTRIDPKIIEKYESRLRKELESAGFYQLLKQRPGPPEEIGIVSKAILDTASVYYATREQLTDRLPPDKHINKEKSVVDYCALYFASLKALENFDFSPGTIPLSDEEFKKYKGREVTKQIITHFLPILEKAETNDKLARMTASYLNGIAVKSLQNIKDRSDLAEIVRDLGIELRGSHNPNYQYECEFEDAVFEDIVGNDEVNKRLKDTINKLVFYDPETKTNPFKKERLGGIPTSMLIYGEPGTGKTLALKAAAKHFIELAKDYEIVTGKRKPIKIISIDPTVANKYYGETSKRLKEKFEEAIDPKAISLIFIEDIESLFPPRENSSHSADNRAMNVLLNMIEGVYSKNRGNYFIVATTNYTEKMDKALQDRFEIHTKAEGPQTQADYEQILKIHINKLLTEDLISISEDEWPKPAKLVKEEHMTGRDIRNITANIVDKIANENGSSYRELYGLSGDELVEAIKSKMKPLTIDLLMAEIKEYIDESKKQKSMHREAVIRQKIESIKLEKEAKKRYNLIQE